MAIIVIFLLLILAKADVNLRNDNSSQIACPENEKQTLLIFKKDLIDSANRFASWDPHRHPDCCSWYGVGCEIRTGHVISLDLGLPTVDVDTESEPYRIPIIRGKINPCLSNLKELRYLDLGNNSFGGLLPYQIGNLSNLEYLNLGGNGFTRFRLYVENLEWLSGLSLLKHLDLSMVDLSKASNWLQVVNRELPSLEELHLYDCQLPEGEAPLLNVNLSSLAILDLSYNFFTNQMDFGWMSKLNSLLLLNLESSITFYEAIPDFLRNVTSSLRHLDLSSNGFNSTIPDWLYSFRSLQVLRLSRNQLHGGISSAIENMTSLNQLDLYGNQLEGKLPRAVGKLCELTLVDLSGTRLNQSISDILEILSGCSSHVSLLESLLLPRCHLSGQLSDHLGHFENLKRLDLSNNSISGPIPTSLGQLSSLEALDISDNSLEGVVSEKHFANLTELNRFFASANSLVLRVNPNWIPPFQLQSLELGSWKTGPSFPLWLRSLKHLQYLDISNSSISDIIPSWFWRISAQISFLDLSNNQISGHVLYPSQGFNCFFLDLSFNNFSGPLPRLSSESVEAIIDLSNNHFSGSLSHFLCYQLNDTISILVLALDNNRLSGEIPDCWIKWPSLMVLHLDGNRFTGKIPSSMGTLTILQSLHLHNNMLQGQVPLSLKNCTRLVAINLGKNELDGRIPRWLGNGLPSLRILILRSNKFQGNLPDHLCALSFLQILDISDNNLFGSIPRCISNFTAMSTMNASMGSSISYLDPYNTGAISEYESVVMKNQILEYSSTLNLVRLVDLSRNNLSGEIPEEVTSLHGLQTLNLSGNHLTGKIPENIGSMVLLETLDLSQNQLSGSIPESMSNMTFLSNLDLSFNNFSGRIPTSSQLQGFNESCYAGNHLCGPPLKDCGGSSDKEPDVRNVARGSGKGHEIKWFYVGMPLGFVAGFWCVMGPLVFNRRWRIIYFRFLEELWWKLCDLCE